MLSKVPILFLCQAKVYLTFHACNISKSSLAKFFHLFCFSTSIGKCPLLSNLDSLVGFERKLLLEQEGTGGESMFPKDGCHLFLAKGVFPKTCNPWLILASLACHWTRLYSHYSHLSSCCWKVWCIFTTWSFTKKCHNVIFLLYVFIIQAIIWYIPIP